MQKKPLVSIIIVNFNGRHLLSDCFGALEKINFAKKDFEVILVDNNSSDDSVPFTHAHFPEVKVIEAQSNLGFTGGNNLGIENARGKYIVLLNSDVTVSPNWLKNLVAAAQDRHVGIVSSRLRFATPFVELHIKSQAIPRSQINASIDHSPVGVLVEDIECLPHELSPMVYYKSGFYDKKEGEVTVRRTNGDARVMLPFPTEKQQHTYMLTLHGYEKNEKQPIPVSVSYGDKELKFDILPFGVRQLKLTIDISDVEQHFVWLVQNAGNIVLRGGYSKDRGSLIDLRDNEMREFYEIESPFFDKSTELLAACGAGCLIKRSVIDHVGVLDGYYFMYYEDIEYSLRAWRAGWKVVYAPKAIAYHKHRATTGASETQFLIEHVERNRMAMVLTHFPLHIILSELVYFTLRFGFTTLKFVVFQFRDNLERAGIWRRRFEGRKAAYLFILRSLPRLLWQRIKLQMNWPIDHRKMDKMLY